MINVITIPARVKYIPFLNTEVCGKNIQKEDITKEKLQRKYSTNK